LALSTQEETKIARMLGIRRGDANAAMSLFACYVGATEGYEEDLMLASKYLHYAARLCHPEALHIIADLYGGGHFGKLQLQPNLEERVKYLRMLCFVDRVIDLNTIRNGQDTEKYYNYEWQAYATLGRLYIMEDSLNQLELGHAISLKLAEENNMTESLFAMGWYTYYKTQRWTYDVVLGYFERALNSGSSYWADQALRYYNGIAEEANSNINDESLHYPYYRE